jgi:tRNA(adenine34) deaminase
MIKYIKDALALAKKAGAKGEIPVGAVIVKDGEIIATGQNRRETDNNALGHAEIEAINSACERLGRWRLDDCELYVTLEPCPMCAGAIINARIKKVVFGAFDKKAGSCSDDSVINLFNLPYNHRPEVWAGIGEKECSEVLTEFFENLREKGNE